MQRSISMALAAIMAVGTAAATLGPANAAPMRATPLLTEQATTSGVQAVHDRRGRRHFENGRQTQRHWRHHRRNQRFAAFPPFYFAFPYFAPPRNYYYYDYYPQRRRPYWQNPGWER
jgi:hypothetical protein